MPSPCNKMEDTKQKSHRSRKKQAEPKADRKSRQRSLLQAMESLRTPKPSRSSPPFGRLDQFRHTLDVQTKKHSLLTHLRYTVAARSSTTQKTVHVDYELTAEASILSSTLETAGEEIILSNQYETAAKRSWRGHAIQYTWRHAPWSSHLAFRW